MSRPDSDDADDPGGRADSAGVPWAGRSFHANPAAGDDGSADPALLAALTAADPVAVVDALRTARVLVPLLAEAGDALRLASLAQEPGIGAHGQRVDKTQELSLVTVLGPGGRTALPAFTSVDAMRVWDAAARPIPVEARRAALAAVTDATELLVLDPDSPTEFALRPPALRALALDVPWLPPHLDPEVEATIRAALADEEAAVGFALATADPASRLAGPDLVIRVSLVPGLSQDELVALFDRVGRRWADALGPRVDELAVRVVTA